MPNVALLAADFLLAADKTDISVRECLEQLELLLPAMHQFDIELEMVPWRKAANLASRYDAMLPLNVWDYFQGNEADFLDQCDIAGQQTQFFNSPTQLRWNANKRYLDHLQRQGAEVIETIIVDNATPENVQAAFEQLEAETIVIKPLVGGGAWRQVKLTNGEPFPQADELPIDDAMIQAFQPSVVAEGEYSFLCFDGSFSHALIKRPKQGDYRIQAMYGGIESAYEPTAEEIQAAEALLRSLPEVPLYARVDQLRGTDGKLKLIELELIEPFLYLDQAKPHTGLNPGALLLAEKLAQRLR